jgi:hypothetical protein
MPHLVVESIDTRQVFQPDDREYLGVRFTSGSQECFAGQVCSVSLELMYYPQVNYDRLSVGTTFTIREGPCIVGYGRVLYTDEKMREK